MSRDSIIAKINKNKGDLVLDLFTMVRLDGFVEDDEDYYYVYTKSNGEEYWSSCVMTFITLRGKLPDKEYKCLVDIFERNVKFKKR